METYEFDQALADVQMDLVVIALRRAGFAATRETDRRWDFVVERLRTNANRAQIALCSPVVLPILF